MPENNAVYVTAFLDTVCAQIRWQRWREEIRKELCAHIEDRMDYLMISRGFSLDEAAKEAVDAMGDPVLIGQALDRQHRPWRFPLFILITLLLWTANLVVLYALIRALC